MMKSTESKLKVWMKNAGTSVKAGIKKLAVSAKDKIDLDALFGKLAVKLRRISTKVINLDATVVGIFDRKASTLTVRAEEKLKKGDLLESEHVQYRVDAVGSKVVQLPFDLGHKTVNITCRVAVLHAI